MPRSTDHILTTHAGSLPRPEDLTRMMWDKLDEKSVDDKKLEARVQEAVAETVKKQLDIGIDLVSDGEMSKPGFSNYVVERFTGFANRAQFVATDLGDFPGIIDKLFVQDEGGRHVIFPNVEGPIKLRDKQAIQKDIEHFKTALKGRSPDLAFISAVTPGQMLFNFPNRYYKSDAEYLEAAGNALRTEYQAIINAGFNLQLDAPDLAMKGHSFADGKGTSKMSEYIPVAIEAMNYAIRDLPAEKIRMHLCWGNYAGPHHHDVELRDIVDFVLKTRASMIYVEAANPRHEHEWEVWQKVKMDGKGLVVGVIDTLTNHVEHPRLVAQRLERFANILGKENVLAGSDCGFGTFVGWSGCDPQVAWLKLRSMVEGAAMASDQLWKKQRAAPVAQNASS